MKMRVAILGASGHIGQAIVRALVKETNIEVVAILRNPLASAFLPNSNKIDIRIGNLENAKEVEYMLRDCDVVINCIYPHGSPKKTLSTTELILYNVSRVPTIKKFIHLSSVAVYGSCITNRVITFTNPRPNTSYGIIKLKTEHFIMRRFKSSNILWFILRLGHVFGPGQNVTLQVLNDIQNPNFGLPFDGSLCSNSISIYTVCKGILNLLYINITPGIYNFAEQPQLSWREIYDLHTNSWGFPSVPSISESHANYLSRYYRQRINSMQIIKKHLKEALIDLGKQYVSKFSFGPLAKIIASRLESAKTHYAVYRAKKSIFDLYNVVVPSPRLFSDPMPGPYLPVLPQTREDLTQMQIDLLNWFNIYNILLTLLT
jgi:nucleoside-diphosphate-sugar epimerase